MQQHFHSGSSCSFLALPQPFNVHLLLKTIYLSLLNSACDVVLTLAQRCLCRLQASLALYVNSSLDFTPNFPSVLILGIDGALRPWNNFHITQADMPGFRFTYPYHTEYQQAHLLIASLAGQ